MWHEPWIEPNMTLRQLIHGPLKPHEAQATLSNYISHNTIDTSTLPFSLPDNITSLITQIFIPRLIIPQAIDKIIWGLTPNGKFTVKSLYKDLQEPAPPYHHHWLWKLNLPPKIIHFLWLVSHQRLTTASYLYHIKVTLSNTCTLCFQSIEIINHLLFNYLHTNVIWAQLGLAPCIQHCNTHFLTPIQAIHYLIQYAKELPYNLPSATLIPHSVAHLEVKEPLCI